MGRYRAPASGHRQVYQAVNTGDPHHKFVTKSSRLGHRPLDRSVITGLRIVRREPLPNPRARTKERATFGQNAQWVAESPEFR